MVRVLLVLLIALILGLKFFSFRHVGADDPTVTLYAGAWTAGKNELRGALPVPEDKLIVLAQGENGFAFEEVYSGIVGAAWLVVGAALLGIVLLHRRA